MTHLHIDIETYSGADLASAGVYKYTEHPDFEVLMVAMHGVDGPDLFTFEEFSGDRYLRPTIVKVLTDPTIIKHAWNAAFERTCLSKWLGIELPPEQWRDTMILSAYNGYPLSLDAAAKALGTEQKDNAGKALIRYFCMPCKPTAANGERTRNLPHHDPEKWEAFKRYCAQDVATEMAIHERLKDRPVPDSEWSLWHLDQRINDRGWLVDMDLVNGAIAMDEQHRATLMDEATHLTGLDNPNSAAQLRAWLEAETGEAVTTLRKGDIPMLLEQAPTDTVRRALELRTLLSKTSVKKYEAIRSCVCADGRVRGLVQFYGANRTGRWAGRLVQVQNLPQNHLRDLDLAREVAKTGDLELMGMLYASVPDTLSQLIRTAFVAPPGHTLAVADFSAIEARVLSWLAGEKWRLDVFNTHGKIYEASAAQMFKVPIESITKASPLRQKGKVAELALGYQGGANALVAMGALKMGIDEAELPGIVKKWRDANPSIVDYWYKVENSAKLAIEGGIETLLMKSRCPIIKFTYTGGTLSITLPSGRALNYPGATLRPGKFGKGEIVYMGMNQMTKQWGRQSTYGGKLVENITQAVARDLLADALMELDRAGVELSAHVHDEIVAQVPTPGADDLMAAICDMMGTPPAWAAGLPQRADGYLTRYYKKDD